MSDLELVEAYRNGNQEAFNTLYRKYKKLILSVIREFTKELQTAKDYHQDIWILIHTKLSKFKDGNFSMWIYTIAKNYCIDRDRRSKSSRTIKEDPINNFSYLDYENESNDNIEDELTVMSEGFKFLTELQKKVLVLRMHGLKHGDIANRLNIPVNTALVNSRYLTIKLRKHFADLGYAFDDSLPIKLNNHYEKSKK
jgi:RNA polymerase sigma-70 factor (ECF subfamily)